MRVFFSCQGIHWYPNVQAREELEHISRAREDEEQLVSNLNRKIAALEEQLHELSDQVQVSDEHRA